jgi:hypothetical protein
LTGVTADNEGLATPGLVEARRAQRKAALDGLRAHLGA